MKKLLSLLLVAVLSVCLLACGNKADKIKPFSFGKDGTSLDSEIENWKTSYNEELSTWKEEYSLRPQKWYKISYESAKQSKNLEYDDSIVDDEGLTISEYSTHAKCSGWYFASPYAFEKKYSLSLTLTGKIVSTREDGTQKIQKYTLKVEEVYIEGITYTKTHSKVTVDKNKTEQTEYSQTSFVKDLINQTRFLGYNLFGLLDYGMIDGVISGENGPFATFVKDRSFAHYSHSENVDSLSTKQYVVKLENKSPFIKGLKLYEKSAKSNNSNASIEIGSTGSVETPTYDDVLATKISIDPSFFGFVSRPKDYHKYF